MAYASSSSSRKNAGPTPEDVVRDVRKGNVKPIYLLMGEESYYIDKLAAFLTDTLLTPEERDFNLFTFYGPDADVDQIMMTAKGFPMGGQRIVIVVREAQALKRIERLELYLKQVQPSSVIVLCYMNGSMDKRLKVTALIGRLGVVCESKKLTDARMPGFVADYLKRQGVAVAPGAAEMMAELVGNDLNRMTSELDKLTTALPADQRALTTEYVRQPTGASKEFNIFELMDALGSKDVLRVNKIAKYFDENEKKYPLQMVLPALFRYFSNVMMAYYAPERTERGIAAWMGLSDWQVKRNILPPMRAYSGSKVMHILSAIRRTDARSKGVGGAAPDNGELMKELVYFILH